METFLREIFGVWGILIIPLFSGVFTSFIIEAINLYRPERKNGNKIRNLIYVITRPRYLNLIVSVLISIACWIMFKSFYSSLFEKFFFLFINISTALIFYNIGGKRVIQKVINSTINRIGNKIENKDDNPYSSPYSSSDGNSDEIIERPDRHE